MQYNLCVCNILYMIQFSYKSKEDKNNAAVISEKPLYQNELRILFIDLDRMYLSLNIL